MAYNSKLGYDPDKDYSVALSNSNLSAGERAQLTQERQAKINDVYGGNEPTYGNTGSTFSQLYGANGAGSSPSYTPTTYFNVNDPNQTAQTGYIINGQTYKDPNGYERVGTNSVVNTAGGRYIKTADGSMPYDQYLEQQLANQPKAMTQAEIMEMIRQYIPDQPAYQPTQWDATKQQLANAAINMKYDDWTQSDQYKALADRYGRQGQMTMQDVLGQISSRTGGLASSYATTAAQQQYNDYMAMLEQAAQQQYNSERGDAIQNAQLAYDFADSDYQRYLDQLSQYNNDRSYAFDVLSQALSQSNYANEWQNTLDQQAWERAKYDDETGYKRGQDAQKAAQDQILTYVSMGQMPPDALIASSGWDRDYIALLLAGQQPSSKGGDGGTPKKDSPKKETTTTSSPAYDMAEPKNIETSMDLPTAVDYSPDEGVIVWNGHRYSSKAAFEDDINNAYNRGNLTSAQVQKILNSLNAMGLRF